MVYDIFISYRRSASIKMAWTIYNALKLKGYTNVFFDYKSIYEGDYNVQILKAITSCKDFILLLSEGSMERCADEDDWVRTEIVTAVKSGCNIVPVQLFGHEIIFPDELPPEFDKIKNTQFVTFMLNEYFDDSIKHISKRLKTQSLHNVFDNEEPTKRVNTDIHILTDTDCNIFDYDEDLHITATASKDTVIHLKKGKHQLKFVSKIAPSVCLPTMEYFVPENEFCDQIEIELRDKVADYLMNSQQEMAKEFLPDTISLPLCDSGNSISYGNAIFYLNQEKTEYIANQQELLDRVQKSGNSFCGAEAVFFSPIEAVLYSKISKIMPLRLFRKHKKKLSLSMNDIILHSLKFNNVYIMEKSGNYIIPIFNSFTNRKFFAQHINVNIDA